MPASPVRIGPFVGGMNTYSGPSAIADNEAVELLNVDIDLDGAVKSRPPVAVFNPPVTSQASHVLGIYRSTTDVVYVIYAFDSVVYAYNTSTLAWTLIVSAVATSCVQYNDKLYIVLKPSGTTQGGGKWDPVGGYVAVATMPRGYDACIYKERMFISASRNDDETSINRIKFSNPANPDTWTSTDTFDVAAGDGQDVMALVVYDSQIVIFKTDSTYVFAYESSPSKGLVQSVNGVIGANNRYSVVEYENNLFAMHENRVYRISNWNWEHANIKVPFVYRNVSNVTADFSSSVSLLDNRLFCRYYDNYYVIGLKTGAWTTWAFSAPRTNLVTNPSFETSVASHFGGGGDTISRVTTTSYVGIACAQSSSTGGSVQTAIVSPWYGDGVVAAGKAFTLSVYVKAAAGFTGTGYARIRWYNASDVEISANSSPVVAFSSSTWTRLAFTATAPANAVKFRWQVTFNADQVDPTFYSDAVLVEETSELKGYIEGTVDYFPSEFVSNPNTSLSTGNREYFGGCYTSTGFSLHSFTDSVTNINEVIDVRLTTKSYDFGPSYAFKRLFWWGVDILSKSTTTFKVSPTVYNTPVTWNQLLGVPFTSLQTWARPLEVSLDVTDSISGSNPSSYRTFVKLLKSLRFRQVSFTIETTVDGTDATGPFRVFSLTSFIDSKELVSKKVS